ncbi:MAG: hypothetical protein PVG30_02535 [Gammaproteobacteria bacterium]|jgi:hypothetical protein
MLEGKKKKLNIKKDEVDLKYKINLRDEKYHPYKFVQFTKEWGYISKYTNEKNDTIENAIEQILKDIRRKTNLVINKNPSVKFLGFDKDATQGVTKLYETAHEFLKINKPINLKTFENEYKNEIQGKKVGENEKHKKYHHHIELIKLFLKAQGIKKINKEINTIKKIIGKYKFKNKLNKKNNDHLYYYVIFLSKITDKKYITLLNFIKNYDQLILSSAATDIVIETIDSGKKNCPFSFNKMERKITIHDNMIELQGDITSYMQLPHTLENKIKTMPCLGKIKYEQEDGNPHLILKKAEITSKTIYTDISEAIKNINKTPLIRRYRALLKLNQVMNKLKENYELYKSKKYLFTKWLLKSSIEQTKENNKKTINETLDIIRKEIRRTKNNIEQKGKNKNTKSKTKKKNTPNISNQIRVTLNKLRGKCKALTYNNNVKKLLKKIEWVYPLDMIANLTISKINKYKRGSFLARFFKTKSRKEREQQAQQLLKNLKPSENNEPIKTHVDLLRIINNAITKSIETDFNKHVENWKNKPSKYRNILNKSKSLLFKHCPQSQLKELIEVETQYLNSITEGFENVENANNVNYVFDKIYFSCLGSSLKNYYDAILTLNKEQPLQNNTPKNHIKWIINFSINKLEKYRHASKNKNEKKQIMNLITKIDRLEISIFSNSVFKYQNTDDKNGFAKFSKIIDDAIKSVKNKPNNEYYNILNEINTLLNKFSLNKEKRQNSTNTKTIFDQLNHEAQKKKTTKIDIKKTIKKIKKRTKKMENKLKKNPKTEIITIATPKSKKHPKNKCEDNSMIPKNVKP